jgi:hypothetical protein
MPVSTLYADMEDAFVKFRLAERDNLYQCIGGGIVPRSRDARGLE